MNKSDNPVKIFIAEDHPIFRKGLAQIINNDFRFKVIGEAEDHLTSLDLIKKLKPDLIIVDITLKNSSGLDLIKDIRLYLPEVFILVLSMHDEKIYAERVLRSGANGYLMKLEAPETVVDAMSSILEGNIYLSEEMSSEMLKKMVSGSKTTSSNKIESLTNRELEIFNFVGKGLSTRDIAKNLHISIKTVENHKANIKEKLNLKNGIELIQKATLWIEENK